METQTQLEAKLRRNSSSDSGLPSFTLEEVAKHNTPESSWIAINGYVYDITKFARLHPGGEKLLRDVAGHEVTETFYDLHRQEVMLKYHDRLCIGTVASETPDDIISSETGDISRVPYAEAPAWRAGYYSPYYNESHIAYRKNLRQWLRKNLHEECSALAAQEKCPTPEIFRKIGEANLLAARLGPGPHMQGRDILGVPGKDFDYFHELITHEEWNRITGTPSFQDGLGGGEMIGLPPVMLFAQPGVKEKVMNEVLSGEKIICLAISEPFAGSDVANIKTTATKTEDGKHYIVNGVKKWITGGYFADYFVTAVRTGGDGIGGVSLLLIERSEGLSTSKMKTSYGSSAGTSYIVMENVKVPVENILGSENGGFQCIMANFNHERWMIIAICVAGARGITEECFKWSMQRKVFGKKLISQPVIRQKLASMVGQVESCHCWLEMLTYQMCKMDHSEQFMRLGGPIALLKQACTRMCYSVSDNACQIFGGRAITKTGMGKFIEEYQRSIKYGAILGGSEEVMADLGVRLAVREFPKNHKL